MGLLGKVTGGLKQIGGKLPGGLSLGGAPDPVVERNSLLEKANLYYEFPMFSIDNPPNNEYLDYCLSHAQHRSGFKATMHTGPKQTGKNFAGSKIQEPFVGVIQGNEIRYMSKLWQFLVPVFGIGLIIKLLQPKPRRSTILYWGTNVYQPQRLMDMISDKDIGSPKIDGAFEIFQFGAQMHPIQTILHVSIGMGEQGKRVKRRNELTQRFELLKRAIHEELAMKPIVFDFDEQSAAHQAEPLYVKKQGILKDVQSRFPY
jgi:hypothetical protein